MFSLHRALSFALVALSLLQFADAYAVDVRGSNAQRLARGLAPAPPKRLYNPHYQVARDGAPSNLPTSSSDSSVPTPPPSSVASSSVPTPPPSSVASSSAASSSASNSDSAPSSSASASSVASSSASSSASPTLPTPGAVQTGSIGVYARSTSPQKRSGQFLGYMGAYGLSSTIGTGAAGDGWIYSFTEPDPLTSVVELNHPSTPYRLSGVAIRSGPQVTLGPANAYYLELQNTRAHTPAASASSTYVYDTYAIGYAQTTIFSVNPSTGLVTVKWVNPDGSTPQTYTAVSGSNIYVTGDPARLAAQLGTTPTLVDIYLDPSSANPQ